MIAVCYVKPGQGMTLFALNPVTAVIRGLLAAQWKAHVDEYNRAFDDEAAATFCQQVAA